MSILVRLVVLSILLATSLNVSAQEAITATVTNITLNVRQEPDRHAARIGQIAPNTQVNVEARNEFGDWALVNAPGIRGWVAIGFIRFTQPIRIMEDLPPSSEVIQSGAAPASGAAPVTAPDGPPPESTDYPAVYLTDQVLRNARAIYERGRQRGNQPFSFIKIGESNTTATQYLCNFGWDSYNLGDYTHLQPIVDAFNTTDSFCRNSVTAQNGFATINVLDSTFAPSEFCAPNQTPLECEYSRYMPAYAFIYIGMADHGVMTVGQYQQNITYIANWLSNRGVIPILQTYPTADTFTDGKPQEFNEALRRVAQSLNIPLLDFRAALYNYDNRGTGPDGYHLSVRDPAETTFTGDELIYGRTFRELQSLQILHDLHIQLNN